MWLFRSQHHTMEWKGKISDKKVKRAFSKKNRVSLISSIIFIVFYRCYCFFDSITIFALFLSMSLYIRTNVTLLSLLYCHVRKIESITINFAARSFFAKVNDGVEMAFAKICFLANQWCNKSKWKWKEICSGNLLYRKYC